MTAARASEATLDGKLGGPLPCGAVQGRHALAVTSLLQNEFWKTAIIALSSSASFYGRV